jgi:hypothetical protein
MAPEVLRRMGVVAGLVPVVDLVDAVEDRPLMKEYELAADKD